MKKSTAATKNYRQHVAYFTLALGIASVIGCMTYGLGWTTTTSTDSVIICLSIAGYITVYRTGLNKPSV